LASNISDIIKSEISSTLESLLSASSNVEDVVLTSTSELDDTQCVKTGVSFDFNGKNSLWNFCIPTKTATQFEYLMLGGVTDLKNSIDDEITDAVKEIVSTIAGSICTSVNAQGFADITGLKSTLGDSSVESMNTINDTGNFYKFIVKLNDENLELYISFDDNMKPFISLLTGTASVENTAPVDNTHEKSTSIISSLLGEESVDNLRLLFDIKMRLSVRLGTKICLLRDVISWDIGEIIELSQMTSEPLDILVNGVVIGTGEAIIVDGKFGIKIKHIGKIK